MNLNFSPSFIETYDKALSSDECNILITQFEKNPNKVEGKVHKDDDYGIRMRFKMAAVSLERWNAKKERLGRFFAKGLCAELFCPTPGEIDLIILPQKQEEKPEENE